MQEVDKKVTILAEKDNAICIKIVKNNEDFGSTFKYIKYEIWTDKEKYIKNIAMDKKGTYMKEIIGSNDECVLEIFDKIINPS